MTGWALNFGAGNWEDIAYSLVRANFSHRGIFVDPVGPPLGVPALPSGVRFVSQAATPDNIRRVLRRGGLPCPAAAAPPVPVDFVKIDVDSCDCELAAAVLAVVRPKVLWLEINLSFPPPVRFSRACHADWMPAFRRWNRAGRTLITHGCSLSAAVMLLRPLGYVLCGFQEDDAVFAHTSIAGLLVAGARHDGLDEFACYAELAGLPGFKHYFPAPWLQEWAALPLQDLLERVGCNLSAFHHLLGVSSLPYSLGVGWPH